MFGKSLFGTKLFSESSFLPEYIPTEDFTFNTYGLQNPSQYGIHISDYTIESPKRGFQTTDVPGGHGLILLEDWFRENPIILRGWVSQPTKLQLDQKIIEFLRNIQGQGGELIMENAGSYKSIKTTMQNIKFTGEHWATTKKEFEVEFSGTKSFWQDLSYNSTAIFGSATLSVDGTMNNSGNTIADPIIIVIFNSASSITGAEFENTSTGEIVQITETISAGDVLIFDSEEKQVTINGTEVEYSGKFPTLQIGLNTFTIIMTGTSCNTDITAKWKNQYLTP